LRGIGHAIPVFCRQCLRKSVPQPITCAGKILRRLLVERDAGAGSQPGSGDGGHDD